MLRGLVVGALKGDPRSVMTLLRVADQTGQFEPNEPLTKITRVIVSWKDNQAAKEAGQEPDANPIPANRDISRDEDEP